MNLTIDDFEPLIGQHFDVPHPESGEVVISLTLSEVTKVGKPHEGREDPFSLMFDGPDQPALGQGSFLLRNETLGEHLIFIVPIRESKGTRRYQAIFN